MDNEIDLEMRITKTLCLQLLWRVHQDARQFFLACERWEPGEPLPRSALEAVVQRLVDDCYIDITLTCPVMAFLGTDKSKTPATPPGNAKSTRAKPSINASIPPGCKKAVDVFTALYPTMSLTDMMKRGGIPFSALKVGGKGDCTSFGLLGRCANSRCSYKHVVCVVAPDRQATISEAIKTATATIKKGAAAS
jgi:hypothetical protein